MDAEGMRLEYVPLAEVERLPRNPKAHDKAHLGDSFKRFGFVSPLILDERSGSIVAGHGRLEALQDAKAKGAEPPERVQVRDDGEWMVPMVRGVSFDSDREAEAYAIADNRLTEVGGWDFPALQTIISELAALGDGNLAGLGYGELELKRLLGMSGDGPLPEMPNPEERVKRVACPECGHEFVP